VVGTLVDVLVGDRCTCRWTWGTVADALMGAVVSALVDPVVRALGRAVVSAFSYALCLLLNLPFEVDLVIVVLNSI